MIHTTKVFSIVRRRRWHPTPVLLPGKSHGQRSLVGCSPWGCEESDTTKRLHFHFSLSCTGEGNGNPLHCSCLDSGAWWAAVYRVAQSQTWLKWHSSSSSSSSRSETEINIFWNFFAFSVIQQMLAIWSLVPLSFLNQACTSGSSQFMYCWSPSSLKILSITLLASKMSPTLW